MEKRWKHLTVQQPCWTGTHIGIQCFGRARPIVCAAKSIGQSSHLVQEEVILGHGYPPCSGRAGGAKCQGAGCGRVLFILGVVVPSLWQSMPAPPLSRVDRPPSLPRALSIATLLHSSPPPRDALTSSRRLSPSRLFGIVSFKGRHPGVAGSFRTPASSEAPRISGSIPVRVQLAPRAQYQQGEKSARDPTSPNDGPSLLNWLFLDPLASAAEKNRHVAGCAVCVKVVW
mmetsp:Transcript_35984/g.94668  ORF Transcript_35984/g.94668 Transcript_35984/m.94668 type:complete len:229 (-) Transcript_35984:24-710(-)